MAHGCGCRRHRRPPFAASAVPLLALLLAATTARLPFAAAAAGDEAAGEGVEQLQLEFPPSRNANDEPVLTPTKETIAGREVYYEVPQAPQGLFFFFHGCVHNGYDHWPQQESCPECRGLPGEVSQTKQALSAGLAFAAMNSLDRRAPSPDTNTARCFSYSEDKDSAIEAVRALRSQLGLDDKPLYFAGVSSGAGFAIKLTEKMAEEVSGVTSIALAVDPLTEDDFDWGAMPPVAFIAMERDAEMTGRILRNQAALRAEGVPAQIIQVDPRVVYWPTFFSDQSAEIDPELSAKVVSALVEIGVLDELGMVTDDPRNGFPGLDWQAQLARLVPELNSGNGTANSVTPDASHVSELLNLAWADHEIDGEFFTAVLHWMDGGASGDLAQLAEEYIIRQPALLSAHRLQPGQKPETAGDPPITPWLTPAPAPSSQDAASPPTAAPAPAPRAANTTAPTVLPQRSNV